ncbi:hypothetical protein P7C70_g4182, partial [Phenoliferia sp. Uapishka_3]
MRPQIGLVPIITLSVSSCGYCSPVNLAASSGSSSASTAPESSQSSTSTYSTSIAAATPPASLSLPNAYTAGPFATGAYSEYYSGYEATQTSVEPQPKVSDWVRGKTFELNLTDPNTVPAENFIDPVVLPPSRSHPNVAAEISKPGANFSTEASLGSLTTAIDRISQIIGDNASDSCGACEENYSARSSGSVIAQVLQFANVTGLDGQMLCAKQMPKSFCTVPPVSTYDASLYFNTTEPFSKVAPSPSGKTMKVLHLSDFHLDARYAVGSEAECSDYLCCRSKTSIASNSTSVALPSQLPAPRYGAYQCDTPYDLAMAAMEAIPILTGTNGTGFNFTIFTELQKAEDLGQRAWVVGHVVAGWDGSAALKNPADLWAQIQARLGSIINPWRALSADLSLPARYSPHVLAATFLGVNTLPSELCVPLYLTYANNGTVKDESTALAATWVGPSLTPLTNLNSGFRMYEVDEKTFDIIDAYAWYSNVSSFSSLDGQTDRGPSYDFEYSTREAYGSNITWPATAPLNATWWHKVTEQMEIQPSLVSQFHQYQGRLSVKTGNCTSAACVSAKVCYIRAGTAADGQACPKGYSSVQ